MHGRERERRDERKRGKRNNKKCLECAIANF
jgi:hypothetical protein